jgi:hypothetical protein
MRSNFVTDLYAAVDRHDSRVLADGMTKDGIFRFANMPDVVGRENIFNFLEGFYKGIKGIRHSNLQSWFLDDRWFATGNVTYTRHDDSQLSVPFAVVLVMEGELIKEYLIFVDNHELFAA